MAESWSLSLTERRAFLDAFLHGWSIVGQQGASLHWNGDPSRPFHSHTLLKSMLRRGILEHLHVMPGRDMYRVVPSVRQHLTCPAPGCYQGTLFRDNAGPRRRRDDRLGTCQVCDGTGVVLSTQQAKAVLAAMARHPLSYILGESLSSTHASPLRPSREEEQSPSADKAGVPTPQEAERVGREGSPYLEAERLAFEAWMRGHHWALSAFWDGKGYVGSTEVGPSGVVCPEASRVRGLWAAWRDRGFLARLPSSTLLPGHPAPPATSPIKSNLHEERTSLLHHFDLVTLEDARKVDQAQGELPRNDEGSALRHLLGALDALIARLDDPFESWWNSTGQYVRSGGSDYQKTFAFNAWRTAMSAIEKGEEGQFEAWWDTDGQYSRAGGGDYEKTFASKAWHFVTQTYPRTS